MEEQQRTPEVSATVEAAPAALAQRGSLSRIGALVALPLTLLSAILYLVGFWSPWLYEITAPSPGSNFPGSAFPSSGSDITLAGLFAFAFRRPSQLFTFSPLVASLFIWDAMPLVGVVLALALWRGRSRSRWLMGVYAAWLVFLTAATGFGVYRAFVELRSQLCAGSCADPKFTVHWQIAWGFWLALSALLLAWIAFAALWLRRVAPNAEAPAETPAPPNAGPNATGRPERRTFSRAYALGVGAFTLGATLWALGLFIVPWVTSGCAGVPLSFAHFSRGSCMGLDGYDMLIAGLVRFALARTLGPLAIATLALHCMELLAVAGAVLAWRLWTLGRARSVWIEALAQAVWLVIVTIMLVVGWLGAAGQIGQPAQLAYGAQGTWGMGPGVWLAVVGIALAWVGGVVAWVGRRRRSSVTPPRQGAH